ncbi:MAG TPA: M48 family metallopeptidase [Balneolaceae bacterium]|nr:M48 family metallopeptidase [Balneolaceae bacterium]
MDLSKEIWISIAVGATSILVRLVSRLFPALFAEYTNPAKELKKIDWRDELLYGSVYGFLFAIVFFLVPLFIHSYKNPSKFRLLLSLFVFLLLATSYNFLIRPSVRFVISNKYEENAQMELWLRKNFGYNFPIKNINDDIINAYAIGVIPFSKTIMLGKPLLDHMDFQELKCILLHEVGHLKYNHLLIKFNAALIDSAATAYFWVYIFPLIKIFGYNFLNVAIAGVTIGGFQVVFLGLVQRAMEYKADLFSARYFGAEEYARALSKLNEISAGKLEKDSLTHPPLEKRIAYVKKHCK